MLVRIYTKPACSLCEKVRFVLERVRERIPFELVEEDIRAHPDLLAAHRYDIPLVLVDEHLAFKLRVDEREVETYLRQVQRGMSVARSEPGQE